MKFDRKLFKEAYKAGYKAAKRLNEERYDSFLDKTAEYDDEYDMYHTNVDTELDADNNFLPHGRGWRLGLMGALNELKDVTGDDRNLENYLRPVNRFNGLFEASKDIMRVHNRVLNSKEKKEMYKSFIAAQDSLRRLSRLVTSANYDNTMNERGEDVVDKVYDKIQEEYNNIYKKYHSFDHTSPERSLELTDDEQTNQRFGKKYAKHLSKNNGGRPPYLTLRQAF